MTWTIPPRCELRAGLASVDCGRGEALLLLHGVGLRAEAWAPQIDRFSRTHRVIALDLPGHGHSPAPAGEPCLHDYVARIDEFLRELDCGAVNVAGHSLGAMLALGLAVESPRRVLRVAALNGVHRRDSRARAAVVARAAALQAGEVDLAAPLRRWFSEQPSGAEAQAREQTAAWLAMADPSGYAAAYRAFAHGDGVYSDRLAEISCPALFLTGECDPNSTAAMSRTMAAACVRGRAVVVPGQRHMASLVAAEAVNAELERWLAEAVTEPAAVS